MTQLYQDLMNNVESSPGVFYYKDEIVNGATLRIFGYRLASYTDWQKPNALESRGITFDITDESNPRVVCRPMQKFFNLFENPFTMDVDLNEEVMVMPKHDGSLVSFYLLNGQLVCKTKMTHFSEQSEKAMAYLKSNEILYEYVLALAEQGYTVNTEYCSPSNRIVLEYSEEIVFVLNNRHNITGEYEIPRMTEQKTIDVESMINQKGIEGYVCITKTGLWFKVKTIWYHELHKSKESFLSLNKLRIAVANETYDDLYQIASPSERNALDDAYNHYKQFVDNSYRKLLEITTDVPEARKEYAILGQQQLSDCRYLFGIYMKLFGVEFTDDFVYDQLKQTYIALMNRGESV